MNCPSQRASTSRAARQMVPAVRAGVISTQHVARPAVMVFLLFGTWEGFFDPFQQSEGSVQAVLLQKVSRCCCHLQETNGNLHTLHMQYALPQQPSPPA